MSSLFNPDIKAITKRIKANMESSRLLLLKYEFYIYMEEQGYPNFWNTCTGIVYPTRDMKKRADRNRYWFFRFNDGTETRIVLDDENKQFQELCYYNRHLKGDR